MRDKSFGVVPLKSVDRVWYALLIQHQAGHWAFPKGHPEQGETPQQAAERELHEETGLSVTRWLERTPLEEHYRFTHKGQLIDKIVQYFPAEVTGELKLQPMELADARWLPLVEAPTWITFPTLANLTRELADELEMGEQEKKY